MSMSLPRAWAAGGTASEALISQADIMPSLLGVCGITPPESVQGRDLSALMLGNSNVEIPESVYAEGRMGQNDEWRMVVRGYDKAVVAVGPKIGNQVTQLYNLADDPLELRVSGRTVAEGTAVRIGERFGLKLTSVGRGRKSS